MNWISSKNKLPVEGEEVLTYMRLKFRLAGFDRKSACFKLCDGGFPGIEKDEVWWIKLTTP